MFMANKEGERERERERKKKKEKLKAKRKWTFIKNSNCGHFPMMGEFWFYHIHQISLRSPLLHYLSSSFVDF
jgi:hypothetical protein